MWGAAGGQAAGAAGELPQLAAAPELAGHRVAAVPFRRLRRRPGREGGRRKPSGGGGGAMAGMFPQDPGHQGGEGTGLEPLTDSPPISVPPYFFFFFSLTALPHRSRTEPRASCPLSLLLRAGWGVLSCRGCLGYVSGEWQCHASGHCLRRAAQDPSGAAPSSSLGPVGTGKRDNQTLSPSVTSACVGTGKSPLAMDAALLQEASSIPSGP